MVVFFKYKHNNFWCSENQDPRVLSVLGPVLSLLMTWKGDQMYSINFLVDTRFSGGGSVERRGSFGTFNTSLVSTGGNWKDRDKQWCEIAAGTHKVQTAPYHNQHVTLRLRKWWNRLTQVASDSPSLETFICPWDFHTPLCLPIWVSCWPCLKLRHPGIPSNLHDPVILCTKQRLWK